MASTILSGGMLRTFSKRRIGIKSALIDCCTPPTHDRASNQTDILAVQHGKALAYSQAPPRKYRATRCALRLSKQLRWMQQPHLFADAADEGIGVVARIADPGVLFARVVGPSLHGQHDHEVVERGRLLLTHPPHEAVERRSARSTRRVVHVRHEALPKRVWGREGRQGRGYIQGSPWSHIQAHSTPWKNRNKSMVDLCVAKMLSLKGAYITLGNTNNRVHTASKAKRSSLAWTARRNMAITSTSTMGFTLPDCSAGKHLKHGIHAIDKTFIRPQRRATRGVLGAEHRT